MIFSTHSLTFRRLWYKEGRERNDTHTGLLLPERAPGDGPRSTAAIRPVRVPFLGRDNRGNNIGAVRYGAIHGYSVSFPIIAG